MDEEHEDSLPRLKFSPLIIAEVDRYINNDVRQRFLAVHWRTETIDYVDKCARAVVDYVSEIAAVRSLTLSLLEPVSNLFFSRHIDKETDKDLPRH
jgi:hypothetical protein